jgi:hypothetical protein
MSGGLASGLSASAAVADYAVTVKPRLFGIVRAVHIGRAGGARENS